MNLKKAEQTSNTRTRTTTGTSQSQSVRVKKLFKATKSLSRFLKKRHIRKKLARAAAVH